MCGWLGIFVVMCSCLFFGGKNVYSFLAVNEPVPSDVLVVEGWVPEYALKEAVNEFRKGKYRVVVTTGAPIFSHPTLLNFDNYAELASAYFVKVGIDEKMVAPVPATKVERDRTYESALALRNWLMRGPAKVHSLDVFTLGAHARRTRMLFQYALGNDVVVGVIAARDETFNSEEWWKYGSGVRSVIGEFLTYAYAKVFFWPDRAQ
jgi:hypothetical protein